MVIEAMIRSSSDNVYHHDGDSRLPYITTMNHRSKPRLMYETPAPAAKPVAESDKEFFESLPEDAKGRFPGVMPLSHSLKGVSHL